jgi:hypothetical protein
MADDQQPINTQVALGIKSQPIIDWNKIAQVEQVISPKDTKPQQLSFAFNPLTGK